MMLLGDVYVARLNKANLAFRLDIDRETPVEQRMDAIQKLLGNDLYTRATQKHSGSHTSCALSPPTKS